MADEPAIVVREADAAASPATSEHPAPATRRRDTPSQSSRGWMGMDEQARNRLLFAIFVAFLVLYPLIDRGIGIGRMGSMNPILIFTLLALGLNIVVGFAGLLDLGYAAFFAIGGGTGGFMTAPPRPPGRRGVR